MFVTAFYKFVNPLLNNPCKYNKRSFFGSEFAGSMSVVVLFICFSLVAVSAAGYSLPEVYGHAFVISTSPSSGQTLDKSPEKVEADINEPVDLTYSKISVISSNGERVDNADLTYVNNDESKLSVSVPETLDDGTYTVSVQMLSQIDGHLTQDTFVFGIGKQGMTLTTSDSKSETTSIFDQLSIGSSIARFPALVGQVLIVGSVFCMLWLWKPILRTKWMEENFALLRKRVENRALYLILVGSIILLISDFAMILSLALSINVSIFDAINTKFGTVWLARTVISFSILFSVLFILYRKRKIPMSVGSEDHKKERVVEYLVIFINGIVTLLTTSLMGHAAAVSSNFFYIMLDFIHNIAASLWIGGVMYLAFVVLPSLRNNLHRHNPEQPKRKMKLELHNLLLFKKPKIRDEPSEYGGDDPSDHILINSIISVIIPRFSFVPIIILGTILLTGPFLLYVLEDDLGLTLSSLYGKVLVAKLILAGMMIVMGAYYQIVIHNRSVSSIVQYTNTPTVSQYQTASKTKKGHIDYSAKKTLSRFNKGLKAEAFLGILLLGTVAILTSTGLPESEQGIQGEQPAQKDLFFLSSSDRPAYLNTVFIPNTDNNILASNNSFNAEASNAYTKVLLSIEPFLPGNNNLQISFLDPNNNPVDFDQVKLKMSFIEESTSPISVTFAPIGVSTTKKSPGVFSANSSFGFTGQWKIEVEGISNRQNVSNIYTVFDAFVKPSLNQMSFNITEFKTSADAAAENSSKVSTGDGTNLNQPLYPIYDPQRNVIWTGDTVLNSGRILEFNLENTSYQEHKIDGARIISQLALDSNDNIWYLDPLNRLVGYYNPQNSSSENYLLFSQSSTSTSSPNPPLSSIIPSEAQGAPSALAVDSKNNVWVTIANTNLVLKFDPQNKTFTKIELPSSEANPLSIVFDDKDIAWVAEGGSSRIAKVLPQSDNYVVREYYPNNTDFGQTKNASLGDPIFITTSPFNDEIFISEHEGNTISIFDPNTETFRKLSLESKEALPFGMVFDKYHNLWIAEHLTDQITVMDPITGEQKGVEIPTSNPFVQYLTTDDTGQVWFAEQRGGGLARVDTTVDSMPPLSSQPNSLKGSAINNDKGIFEFVAGIGFEKFVAPFIALGIIFVSIMYVRTTFAYSNSLQYVNKIQTHLKEKE